MQHYVAVKKTGTCSAKYFLNNFQDVKVKGEIERMIKNPLLFLSYFSCSMGKEKEETSACENPEI